MLFVLMRYAAGDGNFIEDRSLRCSNVATACALRAALVAKGRERRGRLCGACCCRGSGEDKAVVAEVRRQQWNFDIRSAMIEF